MKGTNLMGDRLSFLIKHEADSGAGAAGASGAGAAGSEGGSGSEGESGDVGEGDDDDEGDSDSDDDEDDDLQKRIDAAVSSRANQLNRQHQRALADIERKHEEEVARIKREQARARMTDEEREDDEVREKLEALEKREAELARRERATHASTELAKAALPVSDEVVDLVLGNSEEETEFNVALVNKLIKDKAKALVQEKLKRGSQPAGKGGGAGTPAESLGAQIAREQAEARKKAEERKQVDPWGSI